MDFSASFAVAALAGSLSGSDLGVGSEFTGRLRTANSGLRESALEVGGWLWIETAGELSFRISGLSHPRRGFAKVRPTLLNQQ